MKLNEIFGDRLSLCGWAVGKNLVRIQTRDPRFREAIQHLNREKGPHFRPRLVGIGTNVYLRAYEVSIDLEKGREFVFRQLTRAKEIDAQAA